MLHTRIAPSPSGDMHIGTARTAYFNWLAARATGGSFTLRIDDTNQDKIDPKYTDVILETMEWLGLDYDYLEYQSQRNEIYLDAIKLLLREQQAQRRADGCIVLTKAALGDSWHDEISGDIKVVPDDFSNTIGMVLWRSNNTPTYHLASVVDDYEMGINYIIRGTDHISNTARQIAIFRALECKEPKFAHVGLIHKDGKKLSKRDGAASLLWYREQGYTAPAMLNFLLRMGWGPRIDDKSTAIITKERALELFVEGGSLKASKANIDLAKLDSYNRKYARL